MWGFTTALCPGGLPLVGKMLLDPEPVPSDRRCPVFGPEGEVETRLGCSRPVCLLTPHVPVMRSQPLGPCLCPTKPCTQEGRVWSRAEARLRDTQAWETLEVPCSRQGGSDGQAFSYICVPVGSQQPLTGGQPTTPPVLKVPPCPRGLSGRVKDLGTRCSGAISAGGGTVGGQISESEL